MAEITNPTIDSRHGLVVNFDGENFQDYEKVTLDYRPYRNFKSFLLPLINAATSKKNKQDILENPNDYWVMYIYIL